MCRMMPGRPLTSLFTGCLCGNARGALLDSSRDGCGRAPPSPFVPACVAFASSRRPERPEAGPTCSPSLASLRHLTHLEAARPAGLRKVSSGRARRRLTLASSSLCCARGTREKRAARRQGGSQARGQPAGVPGGAGQGPRAAAAPAQGGNAALAGGLGACPPSPFPLAPRGAPPWRCGRGRRQLEVAAGCRPSIRCCDLGAHGSRTTSCSWLTWRRRRRRWTACRRCVGPDDGLCQAEHTAAQPSAAAQRIGSGVCHQHGMPACIRGTRLARAARPPAAAVNAVRAGKMVLKTTTCRFSGLRIYPGKGLLFIRVDAQQYLFLNKKCKSLYHNRLKPAKLAWTTTYRKQHKKDQVRPPSLPACLRVPCPCAVLVVLEEGQGHACRAP